MNGRIRATLIGVALLFLACASTAQAGPIMEADAFASQWWAQQGKTQLCHHTLDRQLYEDTLAGQANALRTYYPDTGEVTYEQCRISVNPLMLVDLNNPDRMVRRQAWEQLLITLVHEQGHLLALAGPQGTADEEHALGGVMSASIDDIRPTASMVEWAIAKTTEVP